MAINFGINAKEFGARLRERRRMHNILQDEIADYLGVTRARISGVETAKDNPGLAMVIGIKTYFTKVHNDALPYDYWIDGSKIDLQKLTTDRATADSTILQSLVIDKQRIIDFQDQRIKSMEVEIGDLKDLLSKHGIEFN